MENLEKLIYDLYKKNARQCTNEEIYNALLIYTKNQLFERGYQDGKKKIYYISAEFLIGKLLSNNLINLGIYDDVAKFLKENLEVIISFYEGEVVGVILPDKIEYLITKSDPGVKGNTTSTAMKDAELETGMVIKVPMFISEGERILVSTADGKYVSRA